MILFVINKTIFSKMQRISKVSFLALPSSFLFVIAALLKLNLSTTQNLSLENIKFQLCSCQLFPDSRTFLYPERSLMLIAASPCFPLPLSLETNSLVFPIDLSMLSISYSGVIPPLAFCACLFPLERAFRTGPCGSTSFLRLNSVLL